MGAPTQATSAQTQTSWGTIGLPDNTQAIAGYDSISGVYRRVLVDETGKLQMDVIASATVDPASMSGLRVKQNPNEISGQFVTAALTSGGYVNALANVVSGGFVTANVASGSVVRILDSSGMSGQFVTAALTSGGYVNALANIVSGGFVTANTSGSVVRMLDPAGLSGTWVSQSPTNLSGQYITIDELKKAKTLTVSVLTPTIASGGTQILASDDSRKRVYLQWNANEQAVNGSPLQSGQGILLTTEARNWASETYNGALWAINSLSGNIIKVASETG